MSSQIVNSASKKKAVIDTRYKPNKFILKEIKKNVEASQFPTIDINRLRKNINEARQKVLPAKLTNLHF